MVPKRLALYEGVQSPLAAFGMVCGMVFPIMMFPAAILFGLSELLVPELARCAAVGSRRRISYLVGRCLHIGLLYGCACAGVIFLTADGLCGAIYHTAAPAPYLKAFALLIPMLYADSLIDAMTKGLGQQTACVRYNILTSALDVALLFVLLPRFGLHGYFCSFFVTHFINFCLSLRRLLVVSGYAMSAMQPLLTLLAAAASMAGAALAVGPLVRAFGFLGIFFCLLCLLGVVKKADFQWARALVQGK